MVNVTFEIFLVYHIKKYIDENFSCAVLVLYICNLEQLKKDYLTIITAFVKYLYANLLAMCIVIISLIRNRISKPVSKETVFEVLNVGEKPSKVIKVSLFIPDILIYSFK